MINYKIVPSWRKNKKFAVYTPAGIIHFGDKRYKDFMDNAYKFNMNRQIGEFTFKRYNMNAVFPQRLIFPTILNLIDCVGTFHDGSESVYFDFSQYENNDNFNRYFRFCNRKLIMILQNCKIMKL